MIEHIHLQDFGFWVQAAFEFFSQSAISLIALTVSKRISQVNVVYHCGNSDQMALPSVDFLNPLPCAYLCCFVHMQQSPCDLYLILRTN